MSTKDIEEVKEIYVSISIDHDNDSQEGILCGVLHCGHSDTQVSCNKDDINYLIENAKDYSRDTGKKAKLIKFVRAETLEEIDERQ